MNLNLTDYFNGIGMYECTTELGGHNSPWLANNPTHDKFCLGISHIFFGGPDLYDSNGNRTTSTDYNSGTIFNGSGTDSTCCFRTKKGADTSYKARSGNYYKWRYIFCEWMWNSTVIQSNLVCANNGSEVPTLGYLYSAGSNTNIQCYGRSCCGPARADVGNKVSYSNYSGIYPFSVISNYTYQDNTESVDNGLGDRDYFTLMQNEIIVPPILVNGIRFVLYSNYSTGGTRARTVTNIHTFNNNFVLNGDGMIPSHAFVGDNRYKRYLIYYGKDNKWIPCEGYIGKNNNWTSVNRPYTLSMAHDTSIS